MERYPTPHIKATPKDFSKTVIMPGDPLRAEFIANNYLENCRKINEVRCAYAYTGEYEGNRVTVMASGMGMPSMGIYSYELFNIFGVENIIRIGSAGSLSSRVKLKDLIIAADAMTDSNFAYQYPESVKPVCSKKLLKICEKKLETADFNYKIGTIFTTDLFYFEKMKLYRQISKAGALAVEMETAALYYNAKRFKKNALSVCTVTDNVFTGENLESDERRSGLKDMIKLSLDIAKDL